ncbi:hypothetical protein [Neorhizobium alkalisoli]|uniref:hypothetical protein n=1 Tax=Neorhizobium alkalisoli TaxID=528178 RepID=UPI000CFA09FC|nr:hypothetical protein [Neorhizobium alkalisoli]
MTSTTSIKTVTFHNTFQLPGMEREHAPGVFDVQITREPLNVMWEAYHQTMTLMLTSGGLVEAIDITATDLEDALVRDSR